MDVTCTHTTGKMCIRDRLREAPFDYLIHCGDVEGREIFIEALAECPCTIVAGNMTFLQTFPMRKRLLWRDIRYWLHMDIIILCPGIIDVYKRQIHALEP